MMSGASAPAARPTAGAVSALACPVCSCCVPAATVATCAIFSFIATVSSSTKHYFGKSMFSSKYRISFGTSIAIVASGGILPISMLT